MSETSTSHFSLDLTYRLTWVCKHQKTLDSLSIESAERMQSPWTHCLYATSACITEIYQKYIIGYCSALILSINTMLALYHKFCHLPSIFLKKRWPKSSHLRPWPFHLLTSVWKLDEWSTSKTHLKNIKQTPV